MFGKQLSECGLFKRYIEAGFGFLSGQAMKSGQLMEGLNIHSYDESMFKLFFLTLGCCPAPHILNKKMDRITYRSGKSGYFLGIDAMPIDGG